MLAEQIAISTGTLLNLIARRGGQPHQVLSTTPAWYDEGAQRKADQRANAELERAGLLTTRGVDPGLVATVEAIMRPALEYYGWINGGHGDRPVNYTVLAGAADGEAFVLVRNTDRDGVALASIRPEAVLDEFLDQLPRLAAARGPRVAAPRSAVTGAAGPENTGSFSRGVLSRADGADEAEADAAGEVRRILGLRRLGGGSLYVATRDRTGSRQRVVRPVNYLDTTEGRWITEEVPGSGEPLIACVPATPRVLAERLRAAQFSPAA